MGGDVFISNYSCRRRIRYSYDHSPCELLTISSECWSYVIVLICVIVFYSDSLYTSIRIIYIYYRCYLIV
jgi:hypothetical protein